MTTTPRRTRPVVVPPQPAGVPTVGQEQPQAAPRPSSRRERAARRQQTVVQRSRSTHRERTKNRTLNININKGGVQAQVGAAAAAAGQAEQGTPGANFMSNEDVRAFAEYVRKHARNRAVERSLDHEHLYQVLRHIPDATGSKAGSRARARRVVRHLRAIAAAERIIARQGAALWRSFEQEYESNLAKVGKARPKNSKGGPQQPFRFG